MIFCVFTSFMQCFAAMLKQKLLHRGRDGRRRGGAWSPKWLRIFTAIGFANFQKSNTLAFFNQKIFKVFLAPPLHLIIYKILKCKKLSLYYFHVIVFFINLFLCSVVLPCLKQKTAPPNHSQKF